MAVGMHYGSDGTLKMKKISKIAALFFCLGLAADGYAQSAGDDLKKAGNEIKDATKDAAKGSGKAVGKGAQKTKNGVKKGANAAASGVEKGAGEKTK
jgi:hypothetical protein